MTANKQSDLLIYISKNLQLPADFFEEGISLKGENINSNIMTAQRVVTPKMLRRGISMLLLEQVQDSKQVIIID
ncbi:MAG: hypothetical protein OHK0037_11990 [Elainellaceae cyanobacterium]